jgi:hypothetical protein
MLAVPSFIPIRLRGVSWLWLVEAVRPKPSWDQRTATVPRPIRARLRIAWKATCGSSEQAWTQTSPPDSAGSSSSRGSGGSGRSAAGARFCRRHRPGPHQLAQLGRVFAQQVEGSEVKAVLGGGADPGLVLAVEGHVAGALAAGVGELTPCQEPPAPETHGRGAHAGGCQQAAARDFGGRGQGVLATG